MKGLVQQIVKERREILYLRRIYMFVHLTDRRIATWWFCQET